MATEIIGYLVIVLLILQVIFIGLVINLQMNISVCRRNTRFLCEVKMEDLWKEVFWNNLKQ